MCWSAPIAPAISDGLTAVGPFDLPHAVTAARAIANVEATLAGCRLVELDLRNVSDLDGTGAVQLASLLDRVEAAGPSTQVLDEHNPRAARPIAVHRRRRSASPPAQRQQYTVLGRVGSMANRSRRS